MNKNPVRSFPLQHLLGQRLPVKRLLVKRLLAEWSPQDASLICWPHHDSDWHETLAAIETCYADIAAAISSFQVCIIVAKNAEHCQHIRGVLSPLPDAQIAQIRYIRYDYNDTWVRDYGVFSCLDTRGELTLLDFQFNGWGEKQAHERDNRFNGYVFERSAIQTVPFILEGGSIETDGHGTLITSTSCLLHHNRQPMLSLTDIEQSLKSFFNAHRILWLTTGALVGDDTDGHIDNLVRFCPNNTLCYTACSDKNNPNYARLKSMEVEITAWRTANNRPYKTVALPLPKKPHDKPANYTNFSLINDAVLVPIFNDDNDEPAMQILASLFPKRHIVGIDANALIQQNGSIHCATLNLAKGALSRIPAHLFLSKHAHKVEKHEP